MYYVNKNGSLDRLIEKYPSLSTVKVELAKAFELIYHSYLGSGKLLVCGNGGSSSDSEHIVGELMKSFKIKRPIDEELVNKLKLMGAEGETVSEMLEDALPAISLSSHTALSTAIANDTGSDMVFAQQVHGYGFPGDVLLALTTSGNSKNCVYAATVAKATGLKVIAITGASGGRMKELADICIAIPERETYLVQELTLPVYHWLCAELESVFWGANEDYESVDDEEAL